MVWMLGMLGCVLWKEPDLVVRPLASQFVSPGEALQLGVDGLDEQVRVYLRSPDGAEIEVPSSVIDSDSLQLTVPKTQSGAYTLVIRRGEEEDIQPLTIAAPDDERPCRRAYQANTGISSVEGTGYVERFYPDGRREREEIVLSEIEQLEYAFDSAQPCAAILFRRTDGSALLFEDGAEPMLDRARTLSEFVGKPLRSQP